MSNTFQRTINFINTITNKSWSGGYIYGGINLTSTSINFIREYEDQFDIELNDEEDRSISIARIEQYASANIKLIPPRSPETFFAKDIDDYLDYHSFLFKRAEKIYLSDEQETLENGETTGKVLTSYLSALYLFSFIESLSEHASESQQIRSIILFYGNDKISISSDFCGKTLKLLQNKRDLIENIINNVVSDPHAETKKSLFKKVLTDALKQAKDKDRFTLLIENLETINQQFTSNYGACK